MSPLWKELLTTDIGLMSLAVVAISLAVIVYLVFMLAARSAQQ